MSQIPILVQKYGGTSLSTPESRQRVAAHVARARDAGQQVVVVASAMGRRGDPYATDTLLDLLGTDGEEVDPRDYDLMFGCGEAISTALLSHTLKRAGIPAIGLTSAQARIFTDGQHVEAEIEEVDTSRLHSLLAADRVPVVTGGQGVARRTLDVTTLGRGGSDTSAVALGVALHARRVDIFTDVEGVATIDPRLVPDARILRKVSYGAMHEMARFGARVVHPRALLAGWRAQVPIGVRSTFSDRPGTIVGDAGDEAPIVGLALLPPMLTLVLRDGSADTEDRRQWERGHLVMSAVDARSGRLLVGAASDKLNALERVVGSDRAEPLPGESPCCWLSLVGETAAVRDRVARDLYLLARQDVLVHGYEVAERRSTYIVPDEARGRAARAIYDDVFGASSSSGAER